MPTSKIRILARRAKAHLIKFEKADKPIIVMGLRRGGSTMVADAISINKGVWNANEPFAVFPKHRAYDLKTKMLPPREHSQYFNLNATEMEAFSAYVDHLLTTPPPALGSCTRPRFPLRADRISLKVLNAPWMIDWFSQNTDAHILPLVRHPGAQTVSVLRQNWGFAVEAYWNRRDQIGDILTPLQRKMIGDVLKTDDRWRLGILDYAVQSKMYFEKYRHMLVRYEDIVRDPINFVDDVLIGKFGLNDRGLMLQSLSKPSSSSMMSLRRLNTAIQSGKKDNVVNMWKSEMSPDMQKAGQTILDAFEIDIYSFFDQN